jgi:hypothetical protein
LKDGHRNSRRSDVNDRGPLGHQTVTGRGGISLIKPSSTPDEWYASRDIV